MSSEEEQGCEADRRYRPDDIRAALAAMSDADLHRVERAARHFAPRSGMSAEDLRQEAYARALGTRSCRAGTPMVDFLAGIIRSVASEGPRSRRRAREEGGFELVYEAEIGEAGMPEAASPATSPEDEALSRVMHARELERALGAIEGDEQLQLLAEGLFEGLMGKDLEALLGTDTKGLAAARKKLGRRLLARFPEGMPA